MTRRYYVPGLPENGGLVELPVDEAQHATRVMRIQPSDTITLFDGEGRQAEGTVQVVARNQCHCDAGPALMVDREPAISLHLGIALPKPDRAKELIERLTELGVARLTPIVADRTQRPPTDSLLGKLQRVVIEACKQCERNVLMQIDSPVLASKFFAETYQGSRLLAHQGDMIVSDKIFRQTQNVVCAIGPEGGWTEEEVSQAVQNAFQPISLGTRIYRIETAAVAVAVLSSSVR